MDNPTRLFDFIYYQQTHFPQQRAFAFRHNGKEVSHFSTEKIIDMANAVSRGLLQMGLKSGDKIGTVIVKNRPEWTILDFAIWYAGGCVVPIYETSSAEQVDWILKDSGAVGLIVETPALRELVTTVLPSHTKHIWTMTEDVLETLETTGAQITVLTLGLSFLNAFNPERSRLPMNFDALHSTAKTIRAPRHISRSTSAPASVRQK